MFISLTVSVCVWWFFKRPLKSALNNALFAYLNVHSPKTCSTHIYWLSAGNQLWKCIYLSTYIFDVLYWTGVCTYVNQNLKNMEIILKNGFLIDRVMKKDTSHKSKINKNVILSNVSRFLLWECLQTSTYYKIMPHLHFIYTVHDFCINSSNILVHLWSRYQIT